MIRNPRRLVAVLLVALAPISARAQVGNTTAAAHQQLLVDKATLAAEQVLDPDSGRPARRELRLSRAVMICPSVFKMGFFFGGSGGGCVLLARDANGSWSAPAFYSLGSGSFGFQAGVQDEQLMLFIMSQRGMNALLNTHFRLGATAAASFATFGGGIEGATSTALDADIVALELNKGLYAGISLQGSFINSDSDGDAAYFGQPVGPEDIAVAMRVNNPGDDPLRAVLTRDGAPAGVADPGGPSGRSGRFGPPPSYGTASGNGPDTGPMQLAPSGGGVQQQSLPPPPSH